MRHSIQMLLAVLLTVMSFLAVQTVWAEKPDPPESEWLNASGEIVEIERDISTITIDDGEKIIVIKGFPFGYLERKMADVFGDDFVIMVGDCVEVEYAIVVCRCDEGIKNIAVALNNYCLDCHRADCYGGSIQIRDDDFYPVDKSRYGDGSDQNHQRSN